MRSTDSGSVSHVGKHKRKGMRKNYRGANAGNPGRKRKATATKLKKDGLLDQRKGGIKLFISESEEQGQGVVYQVQGPKKSNRDKMRKIIRREKGANKNLIEEGALERSECAINKNGEGMNLVRTSGKVGLKFIKK